jgi:hypothetical protein
MSQSLEFSTLSTEENAAFARIAEREKTSVPALIHRAITEFLARHNPPKPQPAPRKETEKGKHSAKLLREIAFNYKTSLRAVTDNILAGRWDKYNLNDAAGRDLRGYLKQRQET